MVVFKERKLIN